MMETIQMLRKRIVDARAAGDSDFEQTALVMFVAFGHRLEDALRKYADKIVEAACCNNAQRLRELHDGLCALRNCLEEWKLVAEELGVFLKKGGNNDAQA
jgi:hypothetical protein